jgi:carnitine O-acetyltransferase
LSPTNAKNMNQLESCLFTVSLDDYTYSATTDATGALLGHIRNISSGVDATNRWFDKSISLIVESNARFGMMGEHSPVDALIPSIVADWAISEPIDQSVFSRGHSESEQIFELLAWQADEYISSECRLAKERAGTIINDSDANVLHFHEYGIRWIKDEGRSTVQQAAKL